jgi:hypothetical protein
MICDDNDGLDAVAREAGRLLQEIQNRLGTDGDKRGTVAFPRGFIRKRASIESELPNTRTPKYKDSLTKNICYTLIEADVLRWLLVRTNLGLVAQRMVVKEVIRILGDVCDSLIVDSLYGKGGPKEKYKHRTERLLELGVIDSELKQDLDWLWAQRVKIHLWQLRESEFANRKYNGAQYIRARKAYEGGSPEDLGRLSLRRAPAMQVGFEGHTIVDLLRVEAGLLQLG